MGCMTALTHKDLTINKPYIWEKEATEVEGGTRLSDNLSIQRKKRYFFKVCQQYQMLPINEEFIINLASEGH